MLAARGDPLAQDNYSIYQLTRGYSGNEARSNKRLPVQRNFTHLFF